MKVLIEGKKYLESDSMQFILKEYTGNVSTDKKSGNEIEQNNILGYFTTINHAFRFILRMKIMESTATDLKELVIEVKRIESWLRSLLGEEQDIQPKGEGPK